MSEWVGQMNRMIESIRTTSLFHPLLIIYEHLRKLPGNGTKTIIVLMPPPSLENTIFIAIDLSL